METHIVGISLRLENYPMMILERLEMSIYLVIKSMEQEHLGENIMLIIQTYLK